MASELKIDVSLRMTPDIDAKLKNMADEAVACRETDPDRSRSLVSKMREITRSCIYLNGVKVS